MIPRSATARDGRPAVRFRPSFAPRTDEAVRAFRVDLRSAIARLCAAGTPFRIWWNGGPAPHVTVVSADPDRSIALETVLRGAYPAGTWDGSRAPDPDPTRPTTTGALRGVGGLPPLPETIDRPWTGGMGTAFRWLSRPVRLAWTLVPADAPGISAPAAPPVEDRAVPAMLRLAPLTRSEREARDQLELERRRSCWRIAVEIWGAGPSSDLRGAGVGALIDRRVRSATCRGLRWRARRSWLVGALRTFPATDEAVAALFPEPWDRSWGADATRGTIPHLRFGTDVEGHPCWLPWPVDEGRHLAVLGETGMGKSSATVTAALEAARRSGVVLFDPIGDVGEEFVERLPRAWRGRLVRCSAAERSFPVNALAPRPGATPEDAERRRYDLLAALRRVRAFRYPETLYWGPRIEDVLGRALAAAARWPDGTLVEAEGLLAGSNRRPVGAIDPGDPEGARIADLVRERPEEVEGARRLLGEITRSSLLRALLCDRASTCSFDALVRPRTIAVLTGDAETVGEEPARILLAVQLALLWSTLVGRRERTKTVVVLDEAQWYAHEGIAEMLRLGRRSNVHVWLSTQSMGALPKAVADAALTNVADWVLFRGSPVDAREFARWRPDLGIADQISLGRGEAHVLIGKGRELRRIRTAPPPARPTRGTVPLDAELRPPTPLEPSPRPVDPLDALRRLLGPSDSAAQGTVPLSALRRALGSDPRPLRELGRTLKSAGVLVERIATADGPGWVIDRAALARRADGPPATRPGPAAPEPPSGGTAAGPADNT